MRIPNTKAIPLGFGGSETHRLRERLQLEHRHGLHQLHGLNTECLRRVSALLDQRGIVLGAPVHLFDSQAGLRHARGLGHAGGADAADDAGDARDAGDHLGHGRASLVHQHRAALDALHAGTSDATTAKPRPCSPARAASTAALRARMLV